MHYPNKAGLQSHADNR